MNWLIGVIEDDKSPVVGKPLNEDWDGAKAAPEKSNTGCSERILQVTSVLRFPISFNFDLSK